MSEELIECGGEGGAEFPLSHFQEYKGELVHWKGVAPHTLLGDPVHLGGIDVPAELPAGQPMDIELPDADEGGDRFG